MSTANLQGAVGNSQSMHHQFAQQNLLTCTPSHIYFFAMLAGAITSFGVGFVWLLMVMFLGLPGAQPLLSFTAATLLPFALAFWGFKFATSYPATNPVIWASSLCAVFILLSFGISNKAVLIFFAFCFLASCLGAWVGRVNTPLSRGSSNIP
jgi:hypothetical protein